MYALPHHALAARPARQADRHYATLPPQEDTYVDPRGDGRHPLKTLFISFSQAVGGFSGTSSFEPVRLSRAMDLQSTEFEFLT